MLLAGSLHRVLVPPPEVEAAREMTRAHDACRRDLMNARHRVSKMLLRHGRVYPKPTTWTAEHRRWLAASASTKPASNMVFADLLAAVDGLTARKAAIAVRLSQLATDEPWWPTVARLRAFRGIDTLTALALHLELGGDWQRFNRATALAAWLGLTPSLTQSGESSRHGSITKTGSTLARRLLVESAWHYRRRRGSGATLANPPGRPARPHPGDRQPRPAAPAPRQPQHEARGKPHNVTVVACARQLAGFLWAAATAD